MLVALRCFFAGHRWLGLQNVERKVVDTPSYSSTICRGVYFCKRCGAMRAGDPFSRMSTTAQPTMFDPVYVGQGFFKAKR
jgi:hypothetical protein